MLEMASEEMRLPMLPLEDGKRNELRKILTAYGLLA
jgi:hypothetical protein